MIFNMTGGGNPLNFKVVGGTTAPSNPKENTIWVNTDKEITGWHFASEQPEDMKEGEVWMHTGASSSVEFNALKKNNLMAYPTSAKQMVSGALKAVVAKIYQVGKWVDFWDGFLYDKGNEYEDITGGIGTAITHRTTVTKKDEYIQFDAFQNANYIDRYSCCYTNKAIDISNMKTLVGSCEAYKNSDGNGYMKVCLSKNLTDFTNCNKTSCESMIGTNQEGNSSITDVKVDISTMTGLYYLGVYACGSTGNKLHSLKVE